MSDHKHAHKPTYLTPRQIQESCNILNPDDPAEAHICGIAEEFRQGFKVMEKKTEYRKSVTFFGSARTDPKNKYWDDAYRLAKRIGQELGYAIVTGGAQGVMEAANHGAFDAHVPSLGMTIVLPSEQMTNKYVSEEIPFNYFFSRKVLLAYSGEAYIYFPGGFGTFDELFGILTLIQTRKVPPVPIILYGKDFWGPMVEFFKEKLIKEFKTVGPDELLFTMTDDHDEIISIVRNAPIRDGE